MSGGGIVHPASHGGPILTMSHEGCTASNFHRGSTTPSSHVGSATPSTCRGSPAPGSHVGSAAPSAHGGPTALSSRVASPSSWSGSIPHSCTTSISKVSGLRNTIGMLLGSQTSSLPLHASQQSDIPPNASQWHCQLDYSSDEQQSQVQTGYYCAYSQVVNNNVRFKSTQCRQPSPIVNLPISSCRASITTPRQWANCSFFSNQ